MQNVHFTPPTLARMFGVHEATIKRWIDSGLLPAARTPGGHRRVEERDVQHFIRVRNQSEEHSYVLRRSRRATGPEVWRTYFDLHARRRPAEAREHLTAHALRAGSVLLSLEKIVAPALAHIGTAWAQGRLDIADEHRMTFLIRSDILSLESLLPAPRNRAPRVVLACVPGENHELVLTMLALIAREQGWDATVLGINVPALEIERELSARPAQALVLAKVYAGAMGVQYVRDVVRRTHHSPLKIILGGAGWSEPELHDIDRLASVRYLSSFASFASALPKRRSASKSST